jgi:hypothetical protein
MILGFHIFSRGKEQEIYMNFPPADTKKGDKSLSSSGKSSRAYFERGRRKPSCCEISLL